MPNMMKRPFYLRPPWNILFEISKLEKLTPWNILFEINKLDKLTPWNVNIAYLLNSFLSEMEKAGKVDFRASGVALDSSALIYLMKSKLLLTLQEPPARPKPPGDLVPPPLFLPLRHELTSTTIQHLLEVLDDVLKGRFNSLFCQHLRICCPNLTLFYRKSSCRWTGFTSCFWRK